MTDDQVKAAKRFFDRFSEYKKLTKLHSVYIEGARTALKNTGNSRMYVKYNIDGTVTGRISNSGANVGRKKEDKIGVSFHTLPRESLDVNIRNYVVAPKGHDFITIDMKAMELRVLAHVANEENMIHAFKSGVDSIAGCVPSLVWVVTWIPSTIISSSSHTLRRSSVGIVTYPM
jgi:DNA polymerase I-like protein with 3'-5' exonuclease and polymerase domains